MNRIELLKELKLSSKSKKDIIEEREGAIYINVLVKEKNFRIYCGDGRQKLRWLTDSAIFKYENSNDEGIKCGLAYSIKLENGNICDLDDTIANILDNDAYVWILFKQEFEFYQDKLIEKVK